MTVIITIRNEIKKSEADPSVNVGSIRSLIDLQREKKEKVYASPFPTPVSTTDDSAWPHCVAPNCLLRHSDAADEDTDKL